MGVYDTVRVPCPSCGAIYHAQSKGGECDLVTYDLDICPADVLSDVNRHAPFTCESWNTKFDVEYTLSVSSIKVVDINKRDSEDD
jgi:hypothetical protein